MPSVKVSPHIVGSVLQRDVVTELGGILFPRGHKISRQDLEFLEAFKIGTVDIQDLPGETEGKEKSPVKEASPPALQKDGERPSFYAEYERAVNYMEKLMQNVAAGFPIPVLEIRQWLKTLIQYVKGPTGWLLALQPVKASSRYNSCHSVSVALLSSVIARSNRIDENEIMQVALAGLLSDIGKVKIDQRILLKTGRLTYEEYEEVKKHTIWGYQILKGTMGLSEGVVLAALQHHEREDGSGYPLRMKGNQIHLYAKIVAIADVLHAISSLRPYKQGESPFRALEYIRYDNFGRFDPGLVHQFVSSVTQLPLGTPVRLSDGRDGKIIYVDPTHPTRPLVEAGGEIVSLKDHKDLYIEEVHLSKP